MSKIDKAYKTLNEDTVKELEASDAETLMNRITLASEAMRQVEDELEANEKYQRLREDLKAITEGKREVFKRQRAIICICLKFLKDKGVT